MNMRISTLAGVGLVTLFAHSSAPLAAQSTTPWRDLSPHQVRFVTVDASVRLKVLDWGGSGRPVVFVGCYLTGHVYNNIAPKLTDRFHVYAITRRGVGASDHPSTGYSPERRADADILEEPKTLPPPTVVGDWMAMVQRRSKPPEA